MNAEDRAVLQRLATVNQHLGGAVVELLGAHQDDAGLTPQALTALAERMQMVVADLHTLARDRTTARAALRENAVVLMPDAEHPDSTELRGYGASE